MKELHVKSLLPVRLDKYLMDQYPALGLGRGFHDAARQVRAGKATQESLV